MKKLKYLATVFSIIISMLLSFDDSFSSIVNSNSIEYPLQSDCSSVSHHHHQTLTDHFFQKSLISDSKVGFLADYRLFPTNQPFSDHYLSSIWQPPQKS